jgi:hypothetical protein
LKAFVGRGTISIPQRLHVDPDEQRPCLEERNVEVVEKANDKDKPTVFSDIL